MAVCASRSSNPLSSGTGFVRLRQIIGDPRRNIPPLFPISRGSFLNRVQSGEFPRPVKLGRGRAVAWRVEDIVALIKRLGSAATARGNGK